MASKKKESLEKEFAQSAAVMPQLQNVDLATDIPSRAQVIDRLKRGDICDLVVDTETSDLSKYFAHPTSLGAVLADPFTRSIVHVHERKVKFPYKIAAFDVIAGLVTERSPETFNEGIQPDLAVAEIYDLIRDAPKHIAKHYATLSERMQAYNKTAAEKLPLPPEGNDTEIAYQYRTNRRTQYERDERIKDVKETRIAKNVVFIPMRDESGTVVYEAGISDDGKFAYWKEDDKWYRTEAKKTVIMHNQRADNNWLWQWFLRYMLPDQFITHTKKYRSFLLDTIPLAREIATLGPQNRNGLKLGERMDAQLGRVKSASLDSIMAANARIANLRIGLNAGVRIAGGAQADPRMGHVSPAYDCLKTLGLYWYCDDIAPDMVAHKKYVADHDTMRDFLLRPLPDGSPAPFTLVRARYPYLDAHAAVAINMDKAYGDMKKAVTLALDLLKDDPSDPEALLLPDGRNLFDLSLDDWTDMMRKAHSGRFNVLEFVPINKSAMVQPLAQSFASGAIKGVTPETLNRRAQLIHRHRDMCETIMEAYAQTRKRKQESDRQADARPEEYVFSGVGNAIRVQIPRADKDEQSEMERAIFERAQSKIDFYTKRNHYLRILFRPYPEIENKGGDPEAYKEYERIFHKTLRKYERLMRGSILTRKERKEIPRINVPKYKKAKFKNNKQVRKFLWALRQKALKKGWLIDVSSDHYRIVDEDNGREISLTTLSDIDMHHFRRKMSAKNGSWDIYFEHLSHQQHFLALMWVWADKIKTLFKIDPAWKDWYDAMIAFGHNGSPNVGALEQRLPTNERNLHLARRLIAGTTDNKSDLRFFSADPELAQSMRDKLIANLPGREQILKSFILLAQKNLNKIRWKKRTLENAGYNPENAMRQENIVYPIDKNVFDRAPQYTLPDTAPNNPLRSDVTGEMMYPVPLNDPMKKAWESGRLSGLSNSLFRTQHTGQVFLLPKAIFQPKTLPRGSEAFQVTRRIFQDSAMGDIEPDKDPIMMVSAEGCFPVAGTRLIEPHFTLPVLGQHRFRAVIAPEIAGFRDKHAGFDKKLTGLAVPDYGYTTERGYALNKGDTIRLREVHDRDRYETGWEIPVMLKDVRIMTLSEFETAYAAQKITPAFARQYGFAAPEQMYSELVQWFTEYDKLKDDPENRILLTRFQTVKDGARMDFFHPGTTPRAAVLQTYYATQGLKYRNAA